MENNKHIELQTNKLRNRIVFYNADICTLLYCIYHAVPVSLIDQLRLYK